jgi:hypothetical protein
MRSLTASFAVAIAAAVTITALGSTSASAQQGAVYACFKRRGTINLVQNPSDCTRRKKNLLITLPSPGQITTVASEVKGLQLTVSQLPTSKDVADLAAKITALETTVGQLPTSKDVSALDTRIKALETTIGQTTSTQLQLLAALQSYVSVVPSSLNGLAGPHVIFTGVNVHIESGSGSTDDGGTLTGLGNLVVGYNETPPAARLPSPDRGGSHNVIVGDGHEYTSYGGLVAGSQNAVSGAGGSATGGMLNLASGTTASVCGGFMNKASGDNSSVSGGASRSAADSASWAAGSLLESN